MVFRLWGRDTNQVPLPVDVAPSQFQYFRWTSQATETSQREDQPPLSIRTGGQHLCRILPADEVEPLMIRPDRRADTLEWITSD